MKGSRKYGVLWVATNKTPYGPTVANVETTHRFQTKYMFFIWV